MDENQSWQATLRSLGAAASLLVLLVYTPLYMVYDRLSDRIDSLREYVDVRFEKIEADITEIKADIAEVNGKLDILIQMAGEGKIIVSSSGDAQ